MATQQQFGATDPIILFIPRDSIVYSGTAVTEVLSEWDDLSIEVAYRTIGSDTWTAIASSPSPLVLQRSGTPANEVAGVLFVEGDPAIAAAGHMEIRVRVTDLVTSPADTYEAIQSVYRGGEPTGSLATMLSVVQATLSSVAAQLGTPAPSGDPTIRTLLTNLADDIGARQSSEDPTLRSMVETVHADIGARESEGDTLLTMLGRADQNVIELKDEVGILQSLMTSRQRFATNFTPPGSSGSTRISALVLENVTPPSSVTTLGYWSLLDASGLPAASLAAVVTKGPFIPVTSGGGGSGS